MGKIATEQEAYNIGGQSNPTQNKCCTKARAEDLGCKVSDNYEDNQLVQLNDLSKNVLDVYINIPSTDMIQYMRENQTESYSYHTDNYTFSVDIYGSDFTQLPSNDGIVIGDGGDINFALNLESEYDEVLSNNRFYYNISIVLCAPINSEYYMNNTGHLLFEQSYYYDRSNSHTLKFEATSTGASQLSQYDYDVIYNLDNGNGDILNYITNGRLAFNIQRNNDIHDTLGMVCWTQCNGIYDPLPDMNARGAYSFRTLPDITDFYNTYH